MAFGDLELDDTGGSLFAVNLHDRLIYRLSVPDGRILGVFPHGAAREPWGAQARPFALAIRDGWLYHGVVDERDRAGQDGVWAYAYHSRLDGSEMAEVLSLDLEYDRLPRWRGWLRDNSGPMLTDLEFRPNGELVLGLRNRLADASDGVGDGDILPTIRLGERWFAWPEPEHYQDRLLIDESAWGTLPLSPGWTWSLPPRGIL